MSERGACLLRLFTQWRDGAVILAGTGVAPPVYPQDRVARECGLPGCYTLVLGASDAETAARLAEHGRRCHGHR